MLNLGALHCTVSSSPPSPNNVSFSSVNLRNVLQWSPGSGTPDDTHFTVQYAIYGDSVESSRGRRIYWREVSRCTEIAQNWCDLSNETWDQEQGYYARVRAMSRRASSKWALTQRRFDPKSDTSFGPPLVSVEIENNSAIITLKGPMRYQPNNHTAVISMATFYPHMTYNLSVHNARRGKTHHFLLESSLYKYQLMEYDTEYCFSAKARFLSMPIPCRSSAWHCLTMPQDPVIGQLQKMVWGIAVPALCMCVLVVIGYFLHNYLTGKDQKKPYMLNPHPVLPLPTSTICPPDNLNVIVNIVIKDTPSHTDSAISDSASPKHQQPIADPPPRYSPQRSETPPEPQGPWEYLPTDYGFVGVAPKICVVREEDTREARHDRGDKGDHLTSKCQRCIASDSYEQKEWRVEDCQATEVYSHQVKPGLWQNPIHTCMQTHAQTRSQLNSLLLTQESSQSFQRATEDDSEEDRDPPGLFIDKNPQTGLFHIPLNLQIQKEVGSVEDTEGKMRERRHGKMNEGVEKGSKSENVPFLSAYLSNSVKYMPNSHTDQSDSLPDDYGVLRVVHNIKEDEDEEEEGAICINWDPELRKLVLPEMALDFKKEGGLDGLMGEKESEDWSGGEDEEVKTREDELRLKNVVVRQPSEEEAEAQREKEKGGEMDDILTKWGLVFSVDQ